MGDLGRTGVYVLLFLVSLAYNEVVAWLDDVTSDDHPLGGIMVAGAVLYTLIAAYVLDGFTPPADEPNGWIRWDTLIETFLVSGAPLMWGSVGRWLEKRKDWRRG